MKVRVNGNLGEDSINCLNNSIPCKSLEHVFQFLNKPDNQTSDSHFEISIDQKIIHLAKRIRLIALDNYKVHLGPGQVGGMQLPESTIISNSNNAMIEIHPSSKATVIFRKLSFTNFGPNVPAAVLINGPISVTFEQCNFFDNHCSGLNVRDSNLVIRKSNFSDNLANQTNDFDINFSFGNTSLAGNLGIMFEMDGGYYVSIDTCRFERGRAYTNDNEYVISHDTGVKRILSNYYAIGGGVGIVHAFSSKRNTVNITKCHFESNSATYGGGLFLTFIHNTSYNKVFIGESVITKNNVSQTGGGILFSSWDNAHNNGAFFSDCEVSYNDAMGGGGMKIIYNNKDPNNPNQGGALEFQMRRCKIYTNTAMSGAAVRLLFNLPIGRIVPVLPKFVDCTFQGHKPSRNSREYPGAILSSRLSFELEGLNEFISNIKGSAIYMSYSSIHVKGALKFIKNHGRYGGAIYLADVSNIILYPSSSATFTRNQADFQGGALYVQATTLQETTYPYNPGCFVQYSIPKTKHSQWKVGS